MHCAACLPSHASHFTLGRSHSTSACFFTAIPYSFSRFWKGGESLFPEQSGGGGKSELHRARCRVTCSRRRKKADSGIHAGGDAEKRSDGKCHRDDTATASATEPG